MERISPRAQRSRCDRVSPRFFGRVMGVAPDFATHVRFESSDGFLLQRVRQHWFRQFRHFAHDNNTFGTDSVQFPVVFYLPTDLKIRWDLDTFLKDRAPNPRAWHHAHTW